MKYLSFKIFILFIYFGQVLVVACVIFQCSTWDFSSCPLACGILILWAGIKPESPALEDGFLTTRPPGKSWSIYIPSCCLEIYFNSYSLSSLHKLTLCMVYAFYFHFISSFRAHLLYTAGIWVLLFFIHSNYFCLLRHKCLLRDGWQRRRPLGLVSFVSFPSDDECFWTLQTWEWIKWFPGYGRKVTCLSQGQACSLHQDLIVW